MNFIGLVMAGGKGRRLSISAEKPMIYIGKSPMILRVINSLRGCPSILKVYVAVSKYTPKTRNYLLSLGGISVIDTPGVEYHNDMRYAIKKLGEECFVVVSADLPFLEPSRIEEIVRAYKARGKPSLTVVAPLHLFLQLGLNPTWTMEINGKRYVPCGINVVDGSAIEKPYIEETFFITNDPSLCININTLHDLSVAKKLINLRTDKPS